MGPKLGKAIAKIRFLPVLLTMASFSLLVLFQNCSPMQGANLMSSASSTGSLADGTEITASLSTLVGSLTNQLTIPMTLTLSQPVRNFTIGSLTLVNATATNLSGSGLNYSFNLVPTMPGAVSVSLIAGVLQDGSGDLNSASNLVSTTFDPTPASVTIASTIVGTTNVSPIPVTITFSKPVTGLNLSDLIVVNGVASSLAGTGTSFTVDISPGAVGIVSLQVNAGAATDLAGNLSLASNTLSWNFNSISPTTILASTMSGIATNQSSLKMTVSFSEAVTGFSASNIVLTNATLSGFSGSGASYSFVATPTVQGAVMASVAAGAAHDAAGNASLASNKFSIIYDTTPPTGILSTKTTSPTNLTSIPVTLVLSEAVKTFSLSNLTLSNCTATSLSNAGLTYSFVLIPVSQGAIAVSVSNGAITDLAGNPNAATNTLSLTFDSVAPSVTLTSNVGANTTLPSFPVTATFSETVFAPSAKSLSVVNATVSGFNGSGSTYSFTLTPVASGTVSATVIAGATTDMAGNPNTASNEFSTTWSTAPAPTPTPNPASVAFPKGVFGKYQIRSGNDFAKNSPGMISAKGVVGVLITVSWELIQPTSGTDFSWSLLDSAIHEAEAAGLKVEIGVFHGPGQAPSWLVPQKTVSVVATGQGCVDYPTAAVFWDPVFHAARKNLIVNLGQRYGADTNIVGVMGSFANWTDDDYVFPVAIGGANGSCGAFNNVVAWKNAGYSNGSWGVSGVPNSTPADGTMMGVAMDIMNTVATAFPHAYVKLPLHEGSYSTNATNSLDNPALVASVLAYAENPGNPWSSRFVVQTNSLMAGTDTATSSNITNVATEGLSAPGPDWEYYTVLQQPVHALQTNTYNGQNSAGAQICLLGSNSQHVVQIDINALDVNVTTSSGSKVSPYGSPYNCQIDNVDDYVVVRDALAVGLTYDNMFIEMFGMPDAIFSDPATAAIVSSATLTMGGTPRP